MLPMLPYNNIGNKVSVRRPISTSLHIRDLKCIHNTIDHTIPTSLVHSKLDYCNSLLFNRPSTQTNRLQLVPNSAARAVTKTHKFQYVTPLLESLK
jgi:hypothetical protein